MDDLFSFLLPRPDAVTIGTLKYSCDVTQVICEFISA